MSQIGNLYATAGPGQWRHVIRSTLQVPSGAAFALQAQMPVGARAGIGVAAAGDAVTHYSDMSHAALVVPGQGVYIGESGAVNHLHGTPPVAGDRVAIERDTAGIITYRVNGVLIYTSGIASTTAITACVSIQHDDGRAARITLGGAPVAWDLSSANGIYVEPPVPGTIELERAGPGTGFVSAGRSTQAAAANENVEAFFVLGDYVESQALRLGVHDLSTNYSGAAPVFHAAEVGGEGLLTFYQGSTSTGAMSNAYAPGDSLSVARDGATGNVVVRVNGTQLHAFPAIETGPLRLAGAMSRDSGVIMGARVQIDDGPIEAAQWGFALQADPYPIPLLDDQAAALRFNRSSIASSPVRAMPIGRRPVPSDYLT